MSDFEVQAEWAGWSHDERENVDKIWAACYIALDKNKGYFLSVWGRRGTRYNVTKKPFKTLAEARAEYENKVREKRRKNYHGFPFSQNESATYAIAAQQGGGYRFTGGLPSFYLDSNPYIDAVRQLLLGRSSEINEQTLLAYVADLVSPLAPGARRMSLGEVPEYLGDFQELQIRYSVWREFATKQEIARVGPVVDELAQTVERMLLEL